MFKRILVISTLFLWLESVAIASDGKRGKAGGSQGASKAEPKEQAEVDLALAAIGAGSAEEIKGRLFTYRITIFDSEYRSQAVAALPKSISKNGISQGKLYKRVEKVFSQVLQLHDRSGQVDFFLFQGDIPMALLWRGCVLALSDGLVDPLREDELAGVIAHELGHSYFEDEMVDAQRDKNARAMRVVELKCDAVAVLSLKLLGREPSVYLRALQRIREITIRKSLSQGIFQSHPEPVERAQFFYRFIRSLSAIQADTFNHQPTNPNRPPTWSSSAAACLS